MSRTFANSPPSPPRPIPSFSDSDDRQEPNGHYHNRESFTMHGMRSGFTQQSTRSSRPHIDTHRSYSQSPHYGSSGSPQHPSPPNMSPYSAGRGWRGPNNQYHGSSVHHQYPQQPSYRTNTYPPSANPNPMVYSSHHQQQTPYGAPHGHGQPASQGPYRGSQQAFRPAHFTSGQDRRFSGTSHSSFVSHPPRGRGGHFSNLHWNANNGRGRGQYEHQSGGFPRQTSPSPAQQDVFSAPPPADSVQEGLSGEDLEDNPFRPSKDLRVEDESLKEETQATYQASDGRGTAPPSQPAPSTSQDKGSKISFSMKSKPIATAKPDLLQKMRDPAPRRDLLGSNDAPRGRLAARSGTSRHDVRSKEAPVKEKRIVRRLKPRPTLPSDLVNSDSVYFRKPGNESVVGSGTYGKVFKAIHVYTKNKVALKKIRMEGERDGFPVTAIREIKLLQSLNHENVVDLQEVMVERNDCYMVFEYLSHDLTGLLNHPTFKLEHAHKKHLARQLFEGLDYLHRRGVLHRDIKAANILISNEGQLKLADFGLARFFAKRRQLDYTNRVITIWYRSPELLLGETQYGPAVDIWSAACVLVEIFTKHAIFPGDGGEINQLDKIYNVLGTPSRSDWPGIADMAWFELLRPSQKRSNVFAEKYKERVTPEAFDLLSAMFQYDPQKRPAASDVLEHPYFTIEEPPARPATELRDLEGDWHEFESKALRKENERRDKEARRASNRDSQREREREKEKRRAPPSTANEREPKRPRPGSVSQRDER